MWFLDSGCSNHMTGMKKHFQNIDESVKLQVKLGNNKEIQIEGKGTVAIKTESGTEKLIHDVYYIPGLAYNLLSVGQLIQKGYLVTFHDNVCEIRREGSDVPLVIIHMTENRMFPLEFSSLVDSALVVDLNKTSRLWHLRYGHLHFNGLKLLSQKNMVYGLPSIVCDDTLCEGCVYGKQH